MTGSKTHKDHAVFLRVVATLFVLATLCDRISDFPRPVRSFVLWILRPAEAIVRQFVLEFAQDYGFRPTLSEQLFLEDHDSRNAALRLAWRLYTLAQLLEEVLEYVDLSVPLEAGFKPDHTKRLRDLLSTLRHKLQGLAHCAEPWPDTS